MKVLCKLQFTASRSALMILFHISVRGENGNGEGERDAKLFNETRSSVIMSVITFATYLFVANASVFVIIKRTPLNIAGARASLFAYENLIALPRSAIRQRERSAVELFVNSRVSYRTRELLSLS